MNCEEKLILKIVEKNTDLKELFEEHIKDYDELLPHVLMGDITRYLLSNIDINVSNDVSDILGMLNQEIKEGDEVVQELIAVSFVENIDKSAPNFTLIYNKLGDNLKKELLKKQ